MRFRYTLVLPFVYLVLALLSPFFGPLGAPMPFLGMPLSILAEWYLPYGDPTFLAILLGTFQWGIIGLIVDVLFTVGRKQDKTDRKN